MVGNYKALTISVSLIIVSIFFVQSYHLLVEAVNVGKNKVQFQRSVLSNEVHDLEVILSKSKNQSITPKTLAEFDSQHGTDFFAKFGKPAVVAYSGPPISPENELYWELRNALEDKKKNEQQLKGSHMLDFIPPWRLLFVSALGVVIVRLLNKGTDYFCDYGGVKPTYAIGGFLLLTLVLSAIICWL